MGDRLTRLHSPGYANAYPGFLIRLIAPDSTLGVRRPE